MPRPGSSKNPSPFGARPVSGPPPARRWRKRRRNFKKAWTSWRCCRVTPNASDRSLNFAVLWARRCVSSKAQAAPETGQAYARARELWEQLGSPVGVPSDSLWAVPLSRVPRRIRSGAALGRGFAASEPSTQRFRRARSGSLLLRSNPDVCRQICFIPIASGRRCSRFMIRSPTARLSSDRISPAGDTHRRLWGSSCFVSAFPTRHWHRATRRSPRLGGWPIRRLWL